MPFAYAIADPALPLMHVDRHRVYVHAGVDPDLPLAAQDPDQLLWKIYQGPDQGGHGTRHVVHGHHQFRDGPVTIEGRTCESSVGTSVLGLLSQKSAF